MKISGGLKEEGTVVGNVYDKYGSRNPVVRWLMSGFNDSLSELVAMVAPKTIHEIGCGEGYWVIKWCQQGILARGSDFSSLVIRIARENAEQHNLASSIFQSCSIYDLKAEEDGADLVVCCEILEHLEDPESGLQALQRVVQNYLIVSVPREPLWCSLNLVRGKYFTTKGNTPGHIQHWSKKTFIRFLSRYFQVLEVKSPLPWTMLLCRPLK